MSIAVTDDKKNAPDGQDDIDASRAPLLDHLEGTALAHHVGLRALLVGVVVCFFFAGQIFNILLIPYKNSLPPDQVARVIFTGPAEFLFTQLQLALFGGFISPVRTSSIRSTLSSRPASTRTRRMPSGLI